MLRTMRTSPVFPIALTFIFTLHYLGCLRRGKNNDFESGVMRCVSKVLNLKRLFADSRDQTKGDLTIARQVYPNRQIYLESNELQFAQ